MVVVPAAPVCAPPGELVPPPGPPKLDAAAPAPPGAAVGANALSFAPEKPAPGSMD